MIRSHQNEKVRAPRKVIEFLQNSAKVGDGPLSSRSAGAGYRTKQDLYYCEDLKQEKACRRVPVAFQADINASTRRMQIATLQPRILMISIALVMISVSMICGSGIALSEAPRDQLHNHRMEESRGDEGAPMTQSKKKNPKFIIHVGPMKTGTSSLQADLTWLMLPFLEKDNWMYITIRHPMHSIPMDDPEVFLKQFEDEVKELRKLNQNIIRSREQYSVLFANHPWMYARLKDILHDWDVEIVAGYRPYFEYLTSKWYQEFRLPLSDEFVNSESRGLNPWEGKDGTGRLKLVQPIFPAYFQFWKEHSSFTDAVLKAASKHFTVKVFDIHDIRGARTVFLCDIVGEEVVPTACKESRRLDREKSLVKHNPSNVNEIYYDAIALAGAFQGRVNKEKWKRTAVIDALKERHEQQLAKTIYDFPLDCPSKEQLEELWTYTIDLDERCVPSRSEADSSRLDKLRVDFEKAIDRKKFCLVDTDAVLKDPEWQSFFQTFS